MDSQGDRLGALLAEIRHPVRLPILLAGKANGRLKGNRHVRTPDGTPLANVLLTMMNKLGVSMNRIGDSTGQIAI